MENQIPAGEAHVSLHDVYASTPTYAPTGAVWWQGSSSTREHVTSLFSAAKILPTVHGEYGQHILCFIQFLIMVDDLQKTL